MGWLRTRVAIITMSWKRTVASALSTAAQLEPNKHAWRRNTAWRQPVTAYTPLAPNGSTMSSYSAGSRSCKSVIRRLC